MAAKRVTLSKEQKERILSLFEEKPDLNYITQTIFEDPEIDGRSKEGRAIREFLAARNKTYKTTKTTKEKFIELNASQKEFLMSEQINGSMKVIEIARLCLKDEKIKPLSAEHRAIQDYLYKFRPDILDEADKISDGKWHSPKSEVGVIERVNKWCGVTLTKDLKELPVKYKKYIERTLYYLNIHRFNALINAFKTQTDRDLFESEYIRAVWDKPDLTTDETNLYMQVCSNYVRLRHIQLRLDTFNNILENEDMEATEVSMKLTEYIKTTSEELNACENRIEKLIEKLNGKRSARIEKAGANNANILSLVEAWQEKSERDRMAMAAMLRSKLIKEEAERMESMDEFRARIFGIGVDELV